MQEADEIDESELALDHVDSTASMSDVDTLTFGTAGARAAAAQARSAYKEKHGATKRFRLDEVSSVEIDGGDDHKDVYYYRIVLTMRPDNHYGTSHQPVWRRFSDFKELHDALKGSTLMAKKQLPPMPRKVHMMHSGKDPKVVRERTKQFNTLIQAVWNSNARYHQKTRDFLDPGQGGWKAITGQ